MQSHVKSQFIFVCVCEFPKKQGGPMINSMRFCSSTVEAVTSCTSLPLEIVLKLAHVLCVLEFCSCCNYFYLILSCLGNSDFKFFGAGFFFFLKLLIFALVQGDLHIHKDLYDLNDK